MSEPKPTSVFDIDEFKVSTSVKFAMMVKKLKDNTTNKDDVSKFIAEIEDSVTLFCSILSTIVQIDADETALLFPRPTEVSALLMQVSPHSDVLMDHAKRFFLGYITSSLYSKEDVKLYESLVIMFGSCVIFYKMLIKFAKYNGITCAGCQAGCANPVMCEQCKTARYCSKKCRQDGWRAGHHSACKKE